jgi:hypothetical protein
MRGLHQNPRRGPAVSKPLMADRPLATRAGRYTVQLSVVREGIYRVEVLASGSLAQPVEQLTRSYDDENLARGIARVITIALRQPGADVEYARLAVVAYLDGQITLNAAMPSVRAADAVGVLQDIRAGLDTPIGLAALKKIGQVRQVRPTMAGAHVAPLSEPLRNIVKVAHANGGTVLRSRAANASQLRALARRGMATLNYRPGSSRPDPVSATLTERGWREAVA